MKQLLKTTLLACLCAVCNSAIAGSPRTLTPSSATALQGKSSIVLTHQPRDLNLFGMRFLVSGDELSKLKDMLGSDLIIDREVANRDISDGYHLAGSSVPDPAPRLAAKIQVALEARYSLTSPSSAPLILPATPVSMLVPKANVNSILAHSAQSDIALDVETYGWQTYRLNIFSDMWFAYIAKMTMVDVQKKTILVEWTCSHIDRHAWASKPFLLGFLENEKAPLVAALGRAEEHCLNEFMLKLLLIPKDIKS